MMKKLIWVTATLFVNASEEENSFFDDILDTFESIMSSDTSGQEEDNDTDYDINEEQVYIPADTVKKELDLWRDQSSDCENIQLKYEVILLCPNTGLKVMEPSLNLNDYE